MTEVFFFVQYDKQFSPNVQKVLKSLKLYKNVPKCRKSCV